MSLDAHLIHTCTVERPVTSQDAYNNTIPQYEPLYSDLLCRLVVKMQRLVSSEHAAGLVITTFTLLVPGDTQLQERDRITGITLEDGSSDPRIFTVKALLPRHTRHIHHLSVGLEAIS